MAEQSRRRQPRTDARGARDASGDRPAMAPVEKLPSREPESVGESLRDVPGTSAVAAQPVQPPQPNAARGSSQPARPSSVREILQRVDAGWQEFRGGAGSFLSERMDEHLDGGWTRKQMLAHIGRWHELTSERLAKMLVTGKSVPLSEDEEAINARTARQAVGRTAGEVLTDMDTSFNRLRRQIARLTDEQVAADDGWAAHVIAGNTYEHYAEHMADVYRAPSATDRSRRR